MQLEPLEAIIGATFRGLLNYWYEWKIMQEELEKLTVLVAQIDERKPNKYPNNKLPIRPRYEMITQNWYAEVIDKKRGVCERF